MSYSVFVAYLSYFTFGLFDLHHLYLENYIHAFFSMISCNWCCLGFISDFFLIPSYVSKKNSELASADSNLNKNLFYPRATNEAEVKTHICKHGKVHSIASRHILKNTDPNAQTNPDQREQDLHSENFKDTKRIKPSLVLIMSQAFFAQYFSIVFFYSIPPLRDFVYFFSIVGSLFKTEWFKTFLEIVHDYFQRSWSNVGAVWAIGYLGLNWGLRMNFWKMMGAMALLEIAFDSQPQALRIVLLVLYYQINRKKVKKRKSATMDLSLVGKKVVILRYSLWDYIKLFWNGARPLIFYFSGLALFFGAIVSGAYFHSGINLSYEENGTTFEHKYYFRDVYREVVYSEYWIAAKEGYKSFYGKVKEIGIMGILEELNERIVDRMERYEELKAYKLLGIREDAESSEIQSEYRKLAARWHPDRKLANYTKQEQMEHFIKLQKAYKVIEKKRRDREIELTFVYNESVYNTTK